MPDASFQQSSFLGGEWSPQFGGRIDNPRYKTALALSSNGFPIEEGAWIRRSGFRFISASRGGTVSRLAPFNFGEDFPFDTEWTASRLRILSGDNYVLDSEATLVSFSTSSPMTIFVDGGGATWATGDEVTLQPGAGWGGSFGSLPNQQFVLTKITDQTFTLHDPATGASIDGSQIDTTLGQPQATIGRILVFVTPYTASNWYDISPTMFDDTMYLFHQNYVPYALKITNLNATSPALSTFTFGAAEFLDGPYFDPQTARTGGQDQTATVSGTTGEVTVTFANGFGPFQDAPSTADVGRLIRLFNEPDDWDSGHTYGFPNLVAVKYGDFYYSGLGAAAPVGVAPPNAPAFWTANINAAAWVWAEITEYVSPTQVKAQLEYDLLYNNTIRQWRLGIIGNQTALIGNPSCGVAHENRLWMFAANYIMASEPNLPKEWSPTLINGTVTDDKGVIYKLQSGDETQNRIRWAMSDTLGMILGTAAGEWVVKASALDDPITPTSIQARRVTKYGVTTVRPVKTQLSLVFVQKYKRKVMEFLADVFSGKYVAPNIASAAKHLTIRGVEELAYQEELTPIVWSRTMAPYGELRGTTYRRQSAFITEEPTFVGWHQHQHGDPAGRTFSSVVTNPSPDGGALDSLYVVTNNGGAASYQIERMVKQFEEGDSLYSAWFLDAATVPCAMNDVGTGIALAGMYHLAGTDATVFLGGIDAGVFTVSATGSVTVPYTDEITADYLQSLGDQDMGEAAGSATFVVNTTPTRVSTPQTIGNYSLSLTSASSVMAVNYSMLTDFANGRVITIAGDVLSNFMIYVYDLATRTVSISANADTVQDTPTQIYGGGTITPDGYLMLQMHPTSQSVLSKIDPVTLTSVFDYGTNINGGGTGPTGLEYVNSMATTNGGGANFFVAVGQQTGHVGVINTDTMVWAYLPVFGVDTGAYLLRGKMGTTGGVFVVDYSGQDLLIKEIVFSPGAGAWAGVTANPYIVVVNHGTVTPTDVDPTWSHITHTLGGISAGYDQTDGNLIIYVRTSDVVTHTSYLIKVNAATAAVMWRLVVPSNITALGGSNIHGGRLGFMDGSGTIYSINTHTGAATLTFTPAGIGASAPQSYNATTGRLHGLYNYNSGTTNAPTPLSGTPGTFDEIGVLTPGSSLVGDTYTVNVYAAPCVVGYSYTSSGQLLRPGTQQEAGAGNGPPLGKTRRLHMYGGLFRSTQGVEVGENFVDMRPVEFANPDGSAYPLTQLFSGVHWDTIECDYNFDGQLAWRSTGPYPVTVVSWAGFLHTQDR